MNFEEELAAFHEDIDAIVAGAREQGVDEDRCIAATTIMKGALASAITEFEHALTLLGGSN